MKYITLFIALILWAFTATAATISYETNQPIAQSGWSKDFVVPQFNPNLGYLLSAKVTLTRTNLITITADSTGPSPVIESVTVTNGFTMDATSIDYQDSQEVTGANAYAPEGYAVSFDVDEDQYSGTGVVKFHITTVGGSDGSAGGNWRGVQGNYLGAKVRVDYCYVPYCAPRKPCYYRKPICRARIHNGCWR